MILLMKLSLRTFAAIVVLGAAAGCASPRAASSPTDSTVVIRESGDAPASDGQDRVTLIREQVPRSAQPHTRYITALGLPKEIRVTPPDWIVNPAVDGVLGAIGVAPKNDLGTREQLGEARRDARVELAQMLESRIQKVSRGDLESYLQVQRSGDSLVHDNVSKKSDLGVDRGITDLVLSGSRQRALWFDPSNDDCYVWFVMDGRVPGMADHSVENGVSVYVANTPIESEFRPDWPKEPEPKPAPAAPAPPPVEKSPTEKLEEALKPIENIPVKPLTDG